MQNGWTVILSAVGIINLVLGLLVGARDWRKPVNLTFVCLSLTVSLWVFGIAGFLSAPSLVVAFIFAKLFYIAPLLLALMLAYFAYLFPHGTTLPWRIKFLPAAPVVALVLAILFIPTFITDQIVSRSWGREVIVNQWHYSLYALVVVSVFILSFSILYKRARTLSGLYQEQARWLFVAGIMSAVIGGWYNIVLAHWLHDYRYVWVGPLATTFYILSTTLSIIRHRMFDIRLAAVRTVAYILSILTVAIVYFGLAYVASITLFSGTTTTGVSMSPTNIVLAFVLAFIFQPIKQFFDRVTNQIFYRDRYDTNAFLSRIGQVLTSTTKLHEVMSRSAYEIETTLKANGSMFIVYRDHHPDVVVMTKLKNNFTESEYALIHDLATTAGNKALMVPSLEGNHSHDAQHLHALLTKRNVALVLPLVTTNEIIGYLLLGEQLAGNYTKRDIEVLETLADSLIIAIQNARSVQVVRDLNTHLEQRITTATKELRASNRRLVELDATKDEFVSMASHQLRTPLTSIKGYLSMVLEGDVGHISPQQRQLLTEAFTSSERMVGLIGDFLNVSRLQTGKFMIDYRPTDLAKLIAQEVESIRQIADTHGITIKYRQPAVFPMLYLDDNKLRQVVMNFIDNAIYYSPESRTPITLRLTVEDGYAVLRVIDKGMGVPTEVQRQLFTKFFRAENARRQRPDGTGVGLFLAKKVIDGHGGKILFESTEGKGSTFGFRLPIKKLSKPPQADITENTP